METLKISELSVGDWVEYEGLHYPITFVGYGDGGDGSLVNLIRPDLSCFTCKISDIHHIPITPEILEKNGFEKMFRNYDNIYYLSPYIEITLYKDGWWHTINGDEYPIHALNGVHQLQHLLRLAGVDKEINL